MFGMTELPPPYDDEFIGCAIVRASVWSGRALSAIFRELGISGPDVSYFLPIRLARLAQAVGLAAPELLQCHTCFAYSTHYEDEDLVQEFERRLLSSTSHHDSKLIGFLRAFSLQPSALRYCPECVEEDIGREGESYWHRSHNLPLVQTCCIHNVPLWQLPPGERYWHQYRQGLPALGRGVRVKFATSPTAAHALTLHSVRIASGEHGFLRYEREQAIQQKGYMLGTRRFAKAQLSEDLRDFYGSSFLEAMGFAIPDPNHGWPRFLINGRRSGTANSEVLLDVFLLNGTAAAAPHTWKYSKVGKARTPPDIDAELTRLFQTEVAALLAAQLTATLKQVLHRIGACSRYNHQRSRYPQLSAAVADFLVSPARTPPGTPPQRPYWLHNKLGLPLPEDRHPRHDLSAEDATNSNLLRVAIKKLRDEGGRSTVRDLIQGIGFWGRYSRGRTRYPKVARLVDQFRKSPNSARSYWTSQR